jgi:hypothetical protein
MNQMDAQSNMSTAAMEDKLERQSVASSLFSSKKSHLSFLSNLAKSKIYNLKE